MYCKYINKYLFCKNVCIFYIKNNFLKQLQYMLITFLMLLNLLNHMNFFHNIEAITHL